VNISLTLREDDRAVSFKNDGSVTLRSGSTSMYAKDERELAIIARTVGHSSPFGKMIAHGKRILSFAGEKPALTVTDRKAIPQKKKKLGSEGGGSATSK